VNSPSSSSSLLWRTKGRKCYTVNCNEDLGNKIYYTQFSGLLFIMNNTIYNLHAKKFAIHI